MRNLLFLAYGSLTRVLAFWKCILSAVQHSLARDSLSSKSQDQDRTAASCSNCGIKWQKEEQHISNRLYCLSNNLLSATTKYFILKFLRNFESLFFYFGTVYIELVPAEDRPSCVSSEPVKSCCAGTCVRQISAQDLDYSSTMGPGVIYCMNRVLCKDIGGKITHQ